MKAFHVGSVITQCDKLKMISSGLWSIKFVIYFAL